MNILLTGATGFIGKHFVSRHKNHGGNIIPVVRKAEHAEHLGTKECILFNEFTRRKLNELNLRSASLIHLIGTSRDSKKCSMWDSIVETTKTTVEAAREASIRRILYLSGYGVSSQSSEGYFLAKWNAEEIIRTSGIPYTIFKCSYILGSGDELTPYLIENIKRGQVGIPGDGSYRIQPLHVDDVTDILWNAAQEETGKNYTIDLLGHSITFINFVKLLARKLNSQITISNIDFATIMREAMFSPEPNLTTSELAILICDHIGPSSKTYFDVTVRNIEDIVEELVDLS
ncbi:MAG: NAD-dependent epimerase/dehydratase family protein [Bacteroidetes bacterium]|nr:NAD-dependent epimerase/dehydratase family protein [Bacteroidota bacterium]